MYALVPNSTCVRRDDGALIPADPGNADWREYEAWVAAGGVPTPATHPPGYLEAVKGNAKRRVAARADQIAQAITGIVPLAEQLSWPSKEAAARAYVAATATSGQLAMLNAEATLAGESVATLAAKVIANADAYYAASGLIAGQRRKTMAAIDALDDAATVEADLAAIFATAETEAQALLASLVSPA